jgi:hypothetical protein
VTVVGCLVLVPEGCAVGFEKFEVVVGDGRTDVRDEGGFVF